MNVSWRWLTEMVPGLSLSPEELAAHLALRGAPVEGIVRPGAALRDVVVGKVVTAGQHPNADRLSLCTVDGGDGIVSVVCGAPNVKAGSYYPFAPVGAVLPGDFKIKKSKIRGEVSQGMLCSAKELELGVDHDGILELHGEYQPGMSFVEAAGLDDATLDVEITANRGDLLSHLGVARELASEGDGAVALADLPGVAALREPETVKDAREVSHGGVSIRIDDPDLCPRYLGAVLRGVKIGPSPDWLQERLRGAGARPISNVVDVTNYVMLELGQPLHAFDLARLAGPGIVVRRAGPNAGDFTTLDDQARKLAPDMLMICDAERPVAIGGVMGGLNSEVSDETVDILLECAHFDPKSIRKTRRALVMSTDASYRFERGVDPSAMEHALLRAVSLILATAGGELDGPILDCGPQSFEPAVVDLRLSRIERVLGIPFDADTVTALLGPLGFDVVDHDGDVLKVRVPGFRSFDVTREVDLIEEVARSHGFDQFPADLGPFRPGTVPDHPMFALESAIRSFLAASGIFEAQTPAFVAEVEGEVAVANPLSGTEPFVRRDVLPSLLRRLERNLAHGNRDVRLFEIATSFRKSGAGAPPVERSHVALAMTGLRRPTHWARPDEVLDLWDLKGLLEGTAGLAYPDGVLAQPAAEPLPGYVPGRAFVITIAGGQKIGTGGIVAPARIDVPVWAGDVLGFEIELPSEPVARPVAVFQPLPAYPAVERDLALVVRSATSAESVQQLIRTTAGALLEEVQLFDVYEGETIGQGRRSLAFRLRFRSPERTLKDKQVDKVVRSVTTKLKEELGAEHRDS